MMKLSNIIAEFEHLFWEFLKHSSGYWHRESEEAGHSDDCGKLDKHSTEIGGVLVEKYGQQDPC